MASSANQQQPFPYVPPSLSAGDSHEMRDYYPPQDAPRPTINQSPSFKPYLGLRAKLSQVWINRWTILLLLVLVRLLFTVSSTEYSLTSARREALSACTQVETVGSNLASMPHFMAQGINDLTASGIDEAVNGLMNMLELSVTGVEEILIFVIHMMTSTYLCLITLAVSGSLHAAVELGEEITKTLNSTINEVTDDMSNAVKTVTDGINSIISKINFNLPGFNKPSINLDDQIKQLKALELPPDMQQGLEKLNSSIPTFQNVQNFTDNIIRLPFEEIKKLIQDAQNFTFDRNVLPVPDKEALNFCSTGNPINDFFDKLFVLAHKAKNIGIGILIVAAILVIAPMAYLEVLRNRRMESHAALCSQGHDAMDVVYLASRPTTGRFGMWVGKKFGSGRRQAVMRWAWAYATSMPMMFILSLGVAGLFSCFCQWIFLKSIQDVAPELTQEVADFADKVIGSLNNASMSWQGGVNKAIGTLDDKINNDILSWVNTSTSAVNSTLNGFVDEMSSTLNTTFGGTVLYDPITEVLNCLIGLKIAGIEKGLTWVSDHAHVNFPGVSNNTFSLGALAAKSGSSSAAELLANPNGKTKDELTESIDYVVNKLMEAIRKEAIISTFLILIWLCVAIGGYIYALVVLRKRAPAPAEKSLDIVRVIDHPKIFQEYPSTAPPQYFAPTEAMGRVDRYSVSRSSHRGHDRSSSHGQLSNPFSDRGPFTEKR